MTIKELEKELVTSLVVFRACDKAKVVNVYRPEEQDYIRFEIVLLEHRRVRTLINIDLENNGLELWQYHSFESYFKDYEIKAINKAIDYLNKKLKETK